MLLSQLGLGGSADAGGLGGILSSVAGSGVGGVVLMLLIPYTPLQLNAPPLRKIPAKCREIVTSLRAKIAAMV